MLICHVSTNMPKMTNDIRPGELKIGLAHVRKISVQIRMLSIQVRKIRLREGGMCEIEVFTITQYMPGFWLLESTFLNT